MTAQYTDILIYQDGAHSICNEPLSKLLKERSIKFHTPHTALWRGYTASWKLIENKLYLVGLKAYLDYDSVVDLDYLYPDHKEVLAEWFTGEIKINLGKLIEYRHSGYDSIYEKNLIIEVINGVKIREYILNNNTLSKRISRRIARLRSNIISYSLPNYQDDYDFLDK
ncbi:hypothetical protein [Sphingobacterium composti Ten et al. 2007 non Yoo et al. 2007]|uniref:hypothetical protein n=1 Tax=Sphingobacterium composti TaxID=363260 RepID=UPI001358B572|nr:hypothetical protein [Sphingobacterium composti Ten et al. 2007 non Yoo et al. 2007]